MRTRAIACLRRPVDWTSGFGTVLAFRSLLDALDGGEVKRLRALGGVRMLGTRVHLELAEHLPAQRALRQHALDGPAHGLLRLLLQEVGVRLGAQTARVAGVAVDELAISLVRRHLH